MVVTAEMKPKSAASCPVTLIVTVAPLAMALLLAYVALMVAIHRYGSRQTQIFGQVGLSFALIAAAILLANYYIQFSVIPVSLMNNETEGLPVLIQYNPHGVFIALEELGYLVMSLSFLFIAPVFIKGNRLEAAVGWIFFVSCVVAFGSLIVVSIAYGLERLDRFEVVVITINWLVLIVNGILLSILFRRQLKAGAGA